MWDNPGAQGLHGGMSLPPPLVSFLPGAGMDGGGGEEKEFVYMDEEFPSREVGWKCLLALDGMGSAL